MKKILVWLSGWVDSAVVAYILKKNGYDVTAGFMINYLAPAGEYCPTLEDKAVAAQVAEFLEIPFFPFDYVEEYEKKVLQYLYDGYQRWITPNPDILCNSEVKFRIFLEEALALGFDGVATGHYAQIEHEKGTYFLKKWIDPLKDQSYFLSGLDQYQLSKSLFPIGHMHKSEVRALAEEIGLPNAKRKDSQGICFVGKVSMKDFLAKKLPKIPGNIVDTSGNVLGTHEWVHFYTIGQRKWLNIGGLKEGVFVIQKDKKTNTLIVGPQEDTALFTNTIELHHPHFLSEKFPSPLTGKGKIRYRQPDQDCRVYEKNGRYFVHFSEPQRAVAAGQIFAFYDIRERLLFSGEIG